MIPPTSMPPEFLANRIERFLTESPDSVIVEDGEVVFEMSSAKYSISSDQGKCVWHIWSADRNLVRRVLNTETKPNVLRLQVQKFGQNKPLGMEICADTDRRSATAKRSARSAYQKLLLRILRKDWPDHSILKTTASADLEHSFGPAYTRCLIRKGKSAVAVIGVNGQESQATVDATLTAGLLWLKLCRDTNANFLVEGLNLFLPQYKSATVRSRMAYLDHQTAKFHLYEIEERHEQIQEVDLRDAGNVATRLTRAPDIASTLEKFDETIQRIKKTVSGCEVSVVNSTEVAFRFNGLEFARARVALIPGSFRQQQQIVFGTGAYETPLTPESETKFAELMRRLAASRNAKGDRSDALWRMQPERWLESLILHDVNSLDSQLDSAFVYSQVPAFAASDRGMIDVLTCTRSGQLVVIEIKASEDLHLPLQGLDYWSRVNWHHERREFHEFGYFHGRELSKHPPLLYLVSPALQVHPTTDILLKLLSPRIDCTVIGIDERWRDRVRVIFRKSIKRG